MRFALSVVAVAVTATAGCSGSSTPHATAPHVADFATGHFSVRLLDGRCGITYLTGTHAEFELREPACRVRERWLSLDADTHAFATSAQRLVLSTGAVVAPSPDAMHIKRQPDQVTVGAHDAVELDVYFEVPAGAAPRAVRVYGDTDPGISVHSLGPRSVDIPLPALR